MSEEKIDKIPEIEFDVSELPNIKIKKGCWLDDGKIAFQFSDSDEWFITDILKFEKELNSKWMEKLARENPKIAECLYEWKGRLYRRKKEILQKEKLRALEEEQKTEE